MKLSGAVRLYSPMQLVVLRAVRMAEMIDAMICSVHLMVSFFVIIRFTIYCLTIYDLRFGLRGGSGIDDGVDRLLGIAGPAERGIVVQFLLGELTGGLGQQTGTLHGIL